MHFNPLRLGVHFYFLPCFQRKPHTLSPKSTQAIESMRSVLLLLAPLLVAVVAVAAGIRTSSGPEGQASEGPKCPAKLQGLHSHNWEPENENSNMFYIGPCNMTSLGEYCFSGQHPRFYFMVWQQYELPMCNYVFDVVGSPWAEISSTHYQATFNTTHGNYQAVVNLRCGPSSSASHLQGESHHLSSNGRTFKVDFTTKALCSSATTKY